MKSDLRMIPGVGPAIERYLNQIGVTRISALKGRSPQQLYDAVCIETGMQQDRCLLYVLRCAVYYAENEIREAEKLKWWNWKDSV